VPAHMEAPTPAASTVGQNMAVILSAQRPRGCTSADGKSSRLSCPASSALPGSVIEAKCERSLANDPRLDKGCLKVLASEAKCFGEELFWGYRRFVPGG
jgi:hypothetical protein